MIHARIALAIVALGSLAMTGCATTGGGMSVAQHGHPAAGSQLASHQTHQPTTTQANSEIQQVSYETAAATGATGCGCATCSAAAGHGVGHGHGDYCGCGRFSFGVLGTHRCWRCGLFRGQKCGHCGIFGIFNGACGGCGANFQTPHTPAYSGPAGPQSGTYAYPYYTTRGPRDFFMNNPAPLGY